ncbi:MAG: cupin domain-containing protein, partial [Phycisphaerae bacterium]
MTDSSPAGAGEKRWNIYGNRAANPIAPLAHGGGEAQALIDAARGPLAGTVTMRPGDLLYLPRGVYHDALATDGASLHVTFALAPHSGEGVLKLLGQAALRDPQLRAYLP